jgi:hypothetical protein
MPCSPLKVNKRLGGIYRLHLSYSKFRTIVKVHKPSESEVFIMFLNISADEPVLYELINSVALVRERLALVGEVSANFC